MYIYICILLLFLVLLLTGIKNDNTSINYNVFEKKNTYSLRGAAICAIVIHHIGQHISHAPLHLQSITNLFGFLAVGIFFFLSGYGNFLSLKKKQKASLACKIGWLFKRFVGLLITFYIVEVFALFCEMLSGTFVVSQLLGLITLNLPGYVCWYVKIQLLLYIIIFLSFLSQTLSIRAKLCVSFVLCFIATIVLFLFFSDKSYWYNTILCFALGEYVASRSCTSCHNKQHIVCNAIVFTLITCLLLLLASHLQYPGLVQISAAICFAISVITWASIFHFNSQVLESVGKHSFELYLCHSVAIRVFLIINPLYFNENVNVILTILLSIISAMCVAKIDALTKSKIPLFGKTL